MFPKLALGHYEFGRLAIAAHAVCPVDREALLLHAMSCKGIVLHGLARVCASLLVDLPPEGGTVGCAAYMVALQRGLLGADKPAVVVNAKRSTRSRTDALRICPEEGEFQSPQGTSQNPIT